MQFNRLPQGFISASACWDQAMMDTFSPETLAEIKAELTPEEAASLSRSTHKITEIISEGTPTTDSTEIANAFNKFFASAATNIANSLPNSTTDPLSYCPDLPDTIRHLELEGCGPMLVGNTIKGLVSKNSTDLDGISSKLLKAISYEIERPLAHIFSLSLASGTFPEALKSTRVIPIHKAGDTTNCDNYRPISLVNAFSKILEKIVSTKLTQHLEQNNLIYEHQYGFLKGKSTEHALLGVELEVDPAKVLEGLVQVLDEGVLVPGLDHDVVDVCFNVAAQL